MTKPTPCEHYDYQIKHKNGKTWCAWCRAYVSEKPTPEEKCCDRGNFGETHDCRKAKPSPSPEARCAYEHLPDMVCMKCGKYEPVPEARVDLGKEAREIVVELTWHDLRSSDVIEAMVKFGQYAFEKGREAR